MPDFLCDSQTPEAMTCLLPKIQIACFRWKDTKRKASKRIILATYMNNYSSSNLMENMQESWNTFLKGTLSRLSPSIYV